MIPTDYTDIAHRICRDSQSIDSQTALELAQTPDELVFQLMAGADLIRRQKFRSGIHLCAINNAKSGKCSEDCRFCAQSGAYDTRIDTYPLKDEDEIFKSLEQMAPTPVHRYSLVTSGKGLDKTGVEQVASSISRADSFPQKYCASLGILDEKNFQVLSAAGVSRYHHNLETSRSHFSKVCTTHTYEDRIQTIKLAKKAGMSVCSGGIFGIGETMEQVIELAMDIKTLDVDAVPINFFNPG
jgi:biotin synthase